MDIATMATSMKQSNLTQAVNIAVTKKLMDVTSTESQSMIRMLEQTVNPNLGSILDAKA